jgi:hypothetical protein
VAKWFEVTFTVLETQAKKTNKRIAGVPNEYDIEVKVAIHKGVSSY